MPAPYGYRTATQHFNLILVDACDKTGLSALNQAYTMVEGVLLAFRRQLDVEDALRGRATGRARVVFVFERGVIEH